MRARCVIAAAMTLGWSSGCSWFGDVPVEDLGSTDGRLTAADSAPIPERDFIEQLDPGFAGRWVGYVENPFERDERGQAVPAAFPSGSTEVTLDYRFEGEFFTPEASLVFGSGPAPVPQPGVAYPPGVNHYFVTFPASGSFRAPIVEGFEYQLTEPDGRFSGSDPGNASMLSFPELAAFNDWCAVQEPLDRGDGGIDCLGASGFAGGDPLLDDPCIVFRSDGPAELMDCNYVAMCTTDLCSCSIGNGCTFAKSEQLSRVFLERRGDEIIGTIEGATLDSGLPGWYSPMGTLRLYRAD
jgi:hypothetical protein